MAFIILNRDCILTSLKRDAFHKTESKYGLCRSI